jgi:hypothetical protein
MQIVRTEPDSGGPSRTNRQEMAPLFDGKDAQIEPEQYVDVSPSEAWPWDSNPSVSTWSVQIPSVKGITEPFAVMDSQAATEQTRAGAAGAAEAAGGVATYPFSSQYLPLSDQRDDEGDLIIDVNPGNFDTRWAHFLAMYPRFFEHGLPTHGGTAIMTAVSAGDEHFMDEFGARPRDQRPTRARIAHTDGLLADEAEFRRYLSQAKPVSDPGTSTVTPLGSHGEWNEAWVIAIYGEEGGDGHKAYEQYVALAKDHPWVHPVYFASVMSADETTEDLAYLAVPTAA